MKLNLRVLENLIICIGRDYSEEKLEAENNHKFAKTIDSPIESSFLDNGNIILTPVSASISF